MFRPKYPDVENPEYLALCGVHVRKWASIIAIISLISCALSIPGALMFFYIQIPILVVCISIYVALLLADIYEKPIFYLPYLIFTGICLIFGIIEIILLIVLIFLPLTFVKDLLPNNGNLTMITRDEIISGISTTMAPNEVLNGTLTTVAPNEAIDTTIFVVILVFIIVILAISLLIGFYCWNIVRRARNYMIEEVVSGKVARNYATIAGANPKRIQEYRV